MKFRSCAGRRIDLPTDGKRWTALITAGEGAFFYGRQNYYGDGVCETIYVHMPYDAAHDPIHMFRLYRPGEPTPMVPAWTWDENLKSPTLTPSILCGKRERPHWHGPHDHRPTGGLRVRHVKVNDRLVLITSATDREIKAAAKRQVTTVFSGVSISLEGPRAERCFLVGHGGATEREARARCLPYPSRED